MVIDVPLTVKLEFNPVSGYFFGEVPMNTIHAHPPWYKRVVTITIPAPKLTVSPTPILTRLTPRNYESKGVPKGMSFRSISS